MASEKRAYEFHLNGPGSVPADGFPTLVIARSWAEATRKIHQYVAGLNKNRKHAHVQFSVIAGKMFQGKVLS